MPNGLLEFSLPHNTAQPRISWKFIGAFIFPLPFLLINSKAREEQKRIWRLKTFFSFKRRLVR